MDVVQLSAPVFPTAIIVTEWDVLYCRDPGAMNVGQAALQFAVLGQSTIGGATAAVKSAGNTGNGTLTPDPTTPTLSNAEVGVYRVVFTSPTAYNVFSIHGSELGQGANGVAFADQIKFVTTAGSIPFAVGDEFDITIAPGAGLYSPINPTGTDGTQNAAGVALYASDSDGNVTVEKRGPCVLRIEMLQWPTGFTANQIAAGVAQLLALGIKCVTTG